MANFATLALNGVGYFDRIPQEKPQAWFILSTEIFPASNRVAGAMTKKGNSLPSKKNFNKITNTLVVKLNH